MRSPDKIIVPYNRKAVFTNVAVAVAILTLAGVIHWHDRGGMLDTILVIIGLLMVFSVAGYNTLVLSDGCLTQVSITGFQRRRLYIKDIESYYEHSIFVRYMGVLTMRRELILFTTGKPFIMNALSNPGYKVLRDALVAGLFEDHSRAKRFWYKQYLGMAVFFAAVSAVLFVVAFLTLMDELREAALFIGAICLAVAVVVAVVNEYKYGEWGKGKR